MNDHEDESPLDHMVVEVINVSSDGTFVSHPSDFVIECQTVDIIATDKEEEMASQSASDGNVDKTPYSSVSRSNTDSQTEIESISDSDDENPANTKDICSDVICLENNVIVNPQPWEIVTIANENRNERLIDTNDISIVDNETGSNGLLIDCSDWNTDKSKQDGKNSENNEFIGKKSMENLFLDSVNFQEKHLDFENYETSPVKKIETVNSKLNNSLKKHVTDSILKKCKKETKKLCNRSGQKIQQKVNGLKNLSKKTRYTKSYVKNKVNCENYGTDTINGQKIKKKSVKQIPREKSPITYSSSTEIVSNNDSTEKDIPSPINYRYIITHITKDENSILSWCNKVGLIPIQVNCECGSMKEIQMAKDKPLGLIRKCPYCKIRTSVLKGTWFESSHLSIAQIIELTYMWIYKLPQTYVQHELSTSSHHTTGDWYMYCREVCAVILQKNSEKLGGRGKIVELGETKVGKKKFNKGRLLEGQWILGGIERDSRRMFVVSVKERNISTFISILRDWIYPGTTIIAECAKSYTLQSDERLKRFIIKYKINFIDPFTSTHGQSMNNRWKQRDVPDSRKEFPNTYFLEYMYRVKYSNSDDLFLTFVKHLSEVYPGK